MFKITRWGFYLIAFILLVLSTQVMAINDGPIEPIEPIEDPPLLAEPTTDVYFDLGDATAFIENSTTNPSLQVGTINLDFKVNQNQMVTEVTVIKFTFQYDPALVQVVTAYPDPDFGWNPSDNAFDHYPDGTDKYVVEFSLDSKTPPTDFTTIAHFELMPLCQNENSINSLDPVADQGKTYIKSQSGTKYYPTASGNTLTSGTLTVADYQTTFIIADITHSGQADDEVWMAISGTTNSLTRASHIVLNYEDEMVELLEYNAPIAEWPINEEYTEPLADGQYQFRLDNGTNYMRELDNEDVLLIKFRLKCELANNSTLFSFDPAATTNLLYIENLCGAVCDESMIDEGSITFNVTSALKAVYTGTSDNPHFQYSMYNNSNDKVGYEIYSKNSYDMGMLSSSSEKMRYNIYYTPYMLIESGYSVDADFYLASDIEGSQISIEQRWDIDPEASNAWSASENFAKKYSLEFSFKNNVNYTPTWENRYIKPYFIDDYTESQGNTQMPDNQDCVVANATNGYLDISGFDSIRVNIAEFYATDVVGIDNQGCFRQLIKIRNTFDVGSFEFYVSFSYLRFPVLVSYGDYLTGVTCEEVSPNVFKFSTNENFTGIAASENLTNIGYFTFECSEYEFKATEVYTYFSSYTVTDLSNNPQYATHRNGKVELDCDPYLSCHVIQGDESDPPIEKQFDENNLPKVFSLYQNYPNPFNPVTTISLDLPKRSLWNITIYNINGQIVKEFKGDAEAGTISVEWDASQVASGVYFYRVNADEYSATKKMILLK